MDKELKQRAIDSADRMTRAGMTLSAGIMQDLIANTERLGEQGAAQADYIRFLEAELVQAQMGNRAAPEQAKELGEESPQLREIRLNHLVLAGELNN